MKTRRIAWLDSCSMPSHVHLTVDGVDTVCGGHAEYIAGRVLAKTPKKRDGRTNFCRICFRNGGKSAPWDERCLARGGMT